MGRVGQRAGAARGSPPRPGCRPRPGRRSTPVEHCASAASARLGADQAVGGDLERALARRRHARRLGARRRCSVTPKRGFTGSNTARRAHHHAHHHAERRQRVARDPLGKAQRDGGQRRHVDERAVMAFSFLSVDRLARLADRARPRRRRCGSAARTAPARSAPGSASMPVGQQVVVGLVERDRQQHGHARALGRGCGWPSSSLASRLSKRGPRD